MGELNAMGMEKAAARTSVEIHTALSLRISLRRSRQYIWKHLHFSKHRKINNDRPNEDACGGGEANGWAVSICWFNGITLAT